MQWSFSNDLSNLFISDIDGNTNQITNEENEGIETLYKRDALGISEFSSVKISANSDSQILAIEIPMEQE